MSKLEHEKTRTEPSLQTRWSLIGRPKDCGDQRSWQEFFDAYWRLIYTVALKAGLSEAEAQDVVQETVISVAKKMEAATERVKRQVDAEQYQLFDFHVLKQWLAKKVASRLGVRLSRVYFAKYKISAMLKKENERLA